MSVKSQLTGTVVSDKMEKTVVVAVARQVRHSVYGKIQRRTSTFMAHNEDNVAKMGDTVSIAESRPPQPSQALGRDAGRREGLGSLERRNEERPP